MEWNEQEKKVIEKAKFYFYEKLKSHVLIIPRPQFRNGIFTSDIQSSNSGSFYFWFKENDSETAIRLFLNEIFDIEEYIEKDTYK